MNFDYYEGMMDCAEGHPAAEGRTQDYYNGYAYEYESNIDQPEGEK